MPRKTLIMPRKYFHNISLLLVLLLFMGACRQQEYATPVPKSILQNDCIKRSLGPNIVGQNIEFAYAMALPSGKGKIVSAAVEASIPGAAGTYLENNSYHTDGNGNDAGVLIGAPSVNAGAVTKVDFTTDTCAATLRYFYFIPEAARGKSVTFTFSAKSSDGETVSYKMGPYVIAKMDMALNLAVKDGGACYISISDMAVYNAGDAAANPGKIDLVYLYRSIPGISFNHALVSPAADTMYLPGVTLPAGVNRSTRMRKVWNLQDYDLAHEQYGIYIDDLDFQQLDLSGEPNYAVNLKADAGVWVETADSKYKAYIFINSVNNTGKTAVISIKRYTF